MSKINIGILFGGRSAEHEVSVRSARNVIEALDKEKYNPILLGIDKTGKWHLLDSQKFLADSSVKALSGTEQGSKSIALVPQSEGEIFNLTACGSSGKIDVVFPILHGTFGEDGTVQGLLKLADIPFVGAGVLGSAVGMDKDVMKRLLRDADLAIGKFLVYKNNQSIDFHKAVEKLGLPFFVKPANLGSSVGISKVHGQEEFNQAISLAFEFDSKIIIEEFIDGREIECSVLGNDNPIASLPGEIIPSHDFYSYQAKYLDDNGAALEVPANLGAEEIKQIQDLAVKVFKVLSCEGLGRVDFFLQGDGKIFVNEINTLPGFTSISMYPWLWQESGVGYAELIDRLIQLAIERFEKEKRLKTTYV